MGNIIERMAAIASMYVAAGSAYVERRMYKGNPSTKPDPQEEAQAQRATCRKKKESKITNTTMEENVKPIKPSEVSQYIPNWTIKDAKDGDVLCSGQIILLFKKWEDTDWNFVIAYAGIDVSGKLQITNKHWLISNYACPATKQQRELLFRKMKEYGYEWDEDKKELKKL